MSTRKKDTLADSPFIQKFTEVASRIGAQRHLASIRDGFVTLMPIIIVGSLAHILMIDLFGWRAFLSANAPWFLDITFQVWWGSFGMLGIFATASIAYHLAKSYDSDGIVAAIVALASYFTLVPQSGSIAVEGLAEPVGYWGKIDWSFTNANGLFISIIVGLIATEMFVRLRRNKRLVIKMPAGVPPAVSRSFAGLFPGVIVVFSVAIVGVIINKISGGSNAFDLMRKLIEPLIGASSSMGGSIVIVGLNQILWFFGLHGSNILDGPLQAMSLPMIEANVAAAAAGTVLPHIGTKSFLDAFVYMGGSGATIGLIVAIFLVSRSKQMRSMGTLSVAPGIFNINEPIIFGMPIFLNFIYLIPFILAPMLMAIVGHLAMGAGLVAKTTVVVPWPTPPILSGFLATQDLRSIILSIVNLAISIVVYLPFVKVADNIEIKKEQAAANAAFDTAKAM